MYYSEISIKTCLFLFVFLRHSRPRKPSQTLNQRRSGSCRPPKTWVSPPAATRTGRLCHALILLSFLSFSQKSAVAKHFVALSTNGVSALNFKWRGSHQQELKFAKTVHCALKPYFVTFKTQNSPKRAFTETKLQKPFSCKSFKFFFSQFLQHISNTVVIQSALQKII